jgi:predicted transcriptional regulator of viral defense system
MNGGRTMNLTKQSSTQLKHLSDYLSSLEEQGINSFTFSELEKIGASKRALQVSLWRLAKKRRIISPSKGFYVIIPVQYQKLGSLPGMWFIHEWMKALNIKYYIGNLSAAAIYGAAHQAVQETEVIMNKKLQKNNLIVGSVRFQFFYRKNIVEVPCRKWNVPTGNVLVSTPSATAIDLVRYMNRLGGPSAVATVLTELAEQIETEELAKTIIQMNAEIAVLQRLGVIFEIIGQKRLTNVIQNANCFHNLHSIPLNLTVPHSKEQLNKEKLHPIWKVYMNDKIESDI